MKKSLIAVLAIAGLVACNNEEYISTPSADQMTFGVADVENATRAEDPSTTTATLSAFDVWAFMDQPSGTVLVDEDVVKSGSTWAYSNVQYWTPEHDYYFAALAPMNSDNWDLDTATANAEGIGVVDFTNVDGSEDLLYAWTSVNTDEMEIGDDMPAVKFAFKHLLSKINFTFKNGFSTDNVSVIVENVKMTAPAAGTVNLADLSWTVNGETTLEFGNVETLSMGVQATPNYERLTIPAAASQAYTISFDVTVMMGDVVAIDALPFTSELTGAAFEVGKAYNLTATINPENLNLKEIVFDVLEVEEWDNQTINGGAIGEKWEVVSTIEALQAALNAANGNTSISLGANLAGNVTVPELKGATIAINGNGYTFDGTFALVGGSTYAQGTTVFENINFATAGLNGYDAFIYCNEQNGNTRYPDNVVIKDCTFAGANDLPVGAKFRSLNGNLVIENCKAENMHSLVQLSSCGKANVTIDGAVVKNCKNGIGLGQTASATIANSTIEAREYGVRADACATTTDIIKSTIEAKQPVIVRKVTAAGYVLNVDDATVLTTAEPYDIIFTQGSDDEAYVVPVKSFTCNAPAALAVYPQNSVASVEDLKAALNNAEGDVILEADVNVSATEKPWVNVTGEVAINTNENTLTVGNASNYGLFCNAGSNVTLDTDIVAQGGAIVARDGAQVVFNSGSVKIESSSTSQRYIVFAYGAGTTVTINDGTFSFEAYKKRAYGYIADGATLYIKGGVFGAASNHPNDPTAPFIADGGQVVITGGTFGFNPSAWVATGYVATQNGSTWTVAAE